LPLELQAIGQLNQRIDQDDAGQALTDAGCQGQAGAEQNGGSGQGEGNGQGPRGNRPPALAGMGAVSFDIDDVVDQIDGTGDQAETHKRDSGIQPDLWIGPKAEQG